ncbi:MAG TPA: PPOX class F420-dependent oxidoreductase [Micromonosporaceae bacterium]
MSAVEQLGAEKYVLLTTFRKDGRGVPTPVWVAREGGELLAWSASDAGKVKRIRRSGEVTVAACDFRGRPRGSSVAGHATIDDPDATKRVRRLLMRKYGLLGRLTILGSRLRRGERGTVGIRIRLAG